MKTRKIITSVVAIFAFATAFAQNLPSYVPGDGLVGYWGFDGNANDQSGNSNNGTVNGANLTTDRFGNVDSAYSFDGNSSINTNYQGISNQNARSISFWLK